MKTNLNIRVKDFIFLLNVSKVSLKEKFIYSTLEQNLNGANFAIELTSFFPHWVHIPEFFFKKNS